MNKINKVFALLFTLITAFALQVNAQCDCPHSFFEFKFADDSYIKNLYLADFKTKISNDENAKVHGIVYTVKLNKGTKYCFTMGYPEDCNENFAYIELYDRNENKVKSSFDISNNTDKSFYYSPKETENFIMKIKMKEKFESKGDFCVIALLLFVSQE